MKVTNMFIKPYSSGKLLGFVEFEIDGFLKVRDCKLFRAGSGDLFVSLPSKKDEKGKKDEQGRDVYYPTLKVDMETDEGKAFMSQLNSAASQRFAALQQAKQKKTQQQPTQTNTIEDEIPF